jgi:hypothetical protein
VSLGGEWRCEVEPQLSSVYELLLRLFFLCVQARSRLWATTRCSSPAVVAKKQEVMAYFGCSTASGTPELSLAKRPPPRPYVGRRLAPIAVIVPGVQFYGLYDRDLAEIYLSEIVEFYPTLEDADRELREIVHDEPYWAGRYGIVFADFSGAEVAITPVAARS